MARRISADTVVDVVAPAGPVIGDSYFFSNIFGVGYHEECAFDSLDAISIPNEEVAERNTGSNGNEANTFKFCLALPEYKPMTRPALEAVLFSFPVEYKGSFEPFSRPSSPIPSPVKAKIVPAAVPVTGLQYRAPMMVETHSPWVGSLRPTIAQPSYEVGTTAEEGQVQKVMSGDRRESQCKENAEAVILPASACPFDQDCEFCNAF